MGYVKGIIHGVAIGTVVGLSIAPQEGARTREQIRGAIEKLQTGVHRAQATAQRVAPQAREAAGTVGVVLDGLRQKVSRTSPEDEPALHGSPVPNGSGALVP